MTSIKVVDKRRGIADVWCPFLLLPVLFLAICTAATELYAQTENHTRFLRQHDHQDDGLRFSVRTIVRFTGETNAEFEGRFLPTSRTNNELVILVETVDSLSQSSFESYRRLRMQHPEIVVIPALQLKWGDGPPWKSLQLLVSDSPSDLQLLEQLAQRLAAVNNEPLQIEQVLEALEWCRDQSHGEEAQPLLLYSPQAWSGESAAELVQEILKLKRAFGTVTGLPILADTHLNQDTNESFGATRSQVRETAIEELATVHDLSMFSAFRFVDSSGSASTEAKTTTWVEVHQIDSKGGLAAFRTGRFFVAQQGLAKSIELRVDALGLERPASVGEELFVPSGDQIQIELKCDIPELNSTGEPNWADSLQIVVVSHQGTERLADEQIQVGESTGRWQLEVPAGGVTIWGQVTRTLTDGQEIVALTNPVRVSSPRLTASEVLQATEVPFPWISFLAGLVGVMAIAVGVRVFRGRRYSPVYRNFRPSRKVATPKQEPKSQPTVASPLPRDDQPPETRSDDLDENVDWQPSHASETVSAKMNSAQFQADGLGNDQAGCFQVISLCFIILALPAALIVLTGKYLSIQLPYNLIELLEHSPIVVSILLSTSLTLVGVCSAQLSLSWCDYPILFPRVLLTSCIGGSTLLFVCFIFLIPAESIEDIIGTPSSQGFMQFGERWGRFVSLIIGPIIWVIVGVRLPQGAWTKESTLGGIVALTVALISYLVVVPLANTDNLTELLRPGLFVLPFIGLSLFFILSGIASFYVSLILSHGSGVGRLTSLVKYLALVPIAWFLLYISMNLKVQKYNIEFSALQFLLGPNRTDVLTNRQLFARFAFGYIFFTSVMGTGVWLVFSKNLATCFLPHSKHSTSFTNSSNMNIFPRQIHFACATALFVSFAVYGSWVPLNFTGKSLENAIRDFSRIPYLSIDVHQRADWVANILLFVPIGFFGLATFSLGKSRRIVYLALPVWSFTSFCLSVAIEFSQVWFPPRTVSQNDIVAESLGGFIGCVLWCFFGEKWVCLVRRVVENKKLDERLILLLASYSVFLGIYCLLPFDLTIHPKELISKFNDGRIEIIPFGFDYETIINQVYSSVLDVLVFVPVGFLLNQLRVRNFVCLAIAIAGLCEFSQIFVFTRIASVTDCLLGIVGILIGRVVAEIYKSKDVLDPLRSRTSFHSLHQPAIRGFIFFLYSGLLVSAFWYPFDVIMDAGLINKRWGNFVGVPLESLYWGSEYTAISSVLRKCLWFAPLGGMICISAQNNLIQSVVFTIASLALCLTVEVGQVFLTSKIADSIDIAFYVFGIIIGWGGVKFVTHQVL